MLFQIVQPFAADIYGDSFKEAVKNYVKFNQNMNITNLIIRDQANHYDTRLRYYTENNKNKVGIDVYPYTNVTYPTMFPGVLPIGGPIISSNAPVTFAPSMIPVAPPMVTTSGSPYLSTSDNVFVRRPYF
jgi:hypothetical protein